MSSSSSSSSSRRRRPVVFFFVVEVVAVDAVVAVNDGVVVVDDLVNSFDKIQIKKQTSLKFFLAKFVSKTECNSKINEKKRSEK